MKRRPLLPALLLVVAARAAVPDAVAQTRAAAQAPAFAHVQTML
jgi:hypothetical protein